MANEQRLVITGVNEVLGNLATAVDSMKKAGSMAVQMTGAECVVYAKHNAPWTDRTGNARRSIHQESRNSGLISEVGIGVPYGKYLELDHGGKYRIVHPTVFSYGKSQFVKNLKGIL